jgi:hypothetical protein
MIFSQGRCGQEGGIEGLEAYTNRKFISQG